MKVLFITIALILCGCSEKSTEINDITKTKTKTKTKTEVEVETVTPAPKVIEETFTAILSCGMNGSHINIMACFLDSELKITRDGRGKVYKVHELRYLGEHLRDGIHIELPSKFAIQAQNSDETLVLGVKIVSSNGNIVFEDQAGYWGSVYVTD